MKKNYNIHIRVLQLIVLTALVFTSLPVYAHIIGISWKDMGNQTVRFYGETAHDVSTITEAMTEEGASAGSLMFGPWATREYYSWAGVIDDATLAELDVDGMAYWDPDGADSIISDADSYDFHTAGAGGYNQFFYLDITNFSSGEYLLQLERGTMGAISSRLGNDYLTANISVPEPATIAILSIGLVGMAGAEVRRRRKKKAVDKS